MALINCEECGRQISDKAITCPNCGVPLSTFANTVAPNRTVTQNPLPYEPAASAPVPNVVVPPTFGSDNDVNKKDSGVKIPLLVFLVSLALSLLSQTVVSYMNVSDLIKANLVGLNQILWFVSAGAFILLIMRVLKAAMSKK